MIFQFSDGHRIFRPSNITEDVERKRTQKSATVKTYIKEHKSGGFRLILFLHIGCFMQIQPENVLEFNKIQHKLPKDKINVLNHNILIN